MADYGPIFAVDNLSLTYSFGVNPKLMTAKYWRQELKTSLCRMV